MSKVNIQIEWRTKHYDDLSKKELYDAMNLRQVVFVVEQDCPYLDADNRDQNSYHVLGYDKNDKLLAYTRLVPQGTSYPNEAAIGRVTTHPDVRGMGIGKLLMEESIKSFEEVFKTSACRISAQTYLKKYYENFGFEVCSEEYLEDGLPHWEMLRK